MPGIQISPALYAKLQKIAEPFIDTPETAVSKAVEFYLANNTAMLKTGHVTAAPLQAGVMLFQPDAPPDLSFTRPVSIELQGKKFDKANSYWNTLLYEVVRTAALLIQSTDFLKQFLLCNFVDGETAGGGYHFISEAGLSIQGQAANPAWKTIAHIVKALDFQLDVTFVWENKPKAQHPGKTGRMTFSGK